MSEKTGASTSAQFFSVAVDTLSGPATFLALCVFNKVLTFDSFSLKGGGKTASDASDVPGAEMVSSLSSLAYKWLS